MVINFGYTEITTLGKALYKAMFIYLLNQVEYSIRKLIFLLKLIARSKIINHIKYMAGIKIPKKVRIFEVGPRDGLQNEKAILALSAKIAYIEGLIAAGLKDIEVGAFVRDDKIPQMANTTEILTTLRTLGYEKNKGLRFWTLVPNEKGLDRALVAQAKHIAVFTGSTDTFTQKNIGMTVKESLRVFEKVISRARENKINVRGYVSTVWGCPYEGKVPIKKPLAITKALLDMGVDQVSLGDTIGVAAPNQVKELLSKLSSFIKKDFIAGHFHDTRGTALANCYAALEMGITTLDSSSAGLGGCNYAPGASGNVSTEDLVYMLNEMKIKSGVNLDSLCIASTTALSGLNKAATSRYYQAWLSKKLSNPTLSE